MTEKRIRIKVNEQLLKMFLKFNERDSANIYDVIRVHNFELLRKIWNKKRQTKEVRRPLFVKETINHKKPFFTLFILSMWWPKLILRILCLEQVHVMKYLGFISACILNFHRDQSKYSKLHSWTPCLSSKATKWGDHIIRTRSLGPVSQQP